MRPAATRRAAVGGCALAAVISATAAAQQPPVVACEGPFGRNATRADVARVFGQDAVDQEVDGAEGKKRAATVLHPDDPKRRLEIVWSDATARQRPTIRITGQSEWSTANGVRLGMSLAEIARLNGKPFRLYGFEWDYGGRVASWQGGKLARPLAGGCTLSLSLGIDDKTPPALLDKVSGDTAYSSTNPAMWAINPRVFEITLGFGRR